MVKVTIDCGMVRTMFSRKPSQNPHKPSARYVLAVASSSPAYLLAWELRVRKDGQLPAEVVRKDEGRRHAEVARTARAGRAAAERG